VPRPAEDAAGSTTASHGKPLFNPVLWLLNRPQDLPSWLTLDSERVASLTVGRPDYETRQAAARQLAPLFAGYAEASEAARAQFIKSFANGTEGMGLSALADITELANHQQLVWPPSTMPYAATRSGARQPVAQGLPAPAHPRRRQFHRATGQGPAAGGGEGTRHSQAFGDESHRRPGP